MTKYKAKVRLTSIKKIHISLLIIALQAGVIFSWRHFNKASTVPVKIEPHKILGNPSAPLSLVIFSDMACRYCKEAHEQLLKTITIRKDDLKVIYKHFIIRGNSPYSNKVGEAMECAGDQGKFWDYHDLARANGTEWLDNPNYGDVFKGYAKKLGLDEKSFNECYDSGIKESVINENMQEGKSYLVVGTPTAFLNGRWIIANFDFKYLNAVIDQELRELKGDSR